MRSILCASIAALAVTCLCGGCVTGLREIDISKIHSAELSNAKASVKKGDGKLRVSITVVDKRVFEESPRDPSHPSVGWGADDLDKACLIGRQRNSYGMGMGAVAARNGFTVAGHIGKLVEESFIKAGCEVVKNGRLEDGVVPVRVEVSQFWGWVTTGFWTVSVTVRSDMRLTISYGTKTGDVSSLVESKRHSMAVADGTWLTAYTDNADSVVKDLVEKIKQQQLQ